MPQVAGAATCCGLHAPCRSVLRDEKQHLAFDCQQHVRYQLTGTPQLLHTPVSLMSSSQRHRVCSVHHMDSTRSQDDRAQRRPAQHSSRRDVCTRLTVNSTCCGGGSTLPAAPGRGIPEAQHVESLLPQREQVRGGPCTPVSSAALAGSRMCGMHRGMLRLHCLPVTAGGLVQPQRAQSAWSSSRKCLPGTCCAGTSGLEGCRCR